MKTLTLVSLILLCSSIKSNAAEFEFIADDDKHTTKICIAAATDNTKVMIDGLRRLSQKATVLNYRSIVNLIRCNNQYIGSFAKAYNAQKSFVYLSKYTSKRNQMRQTNITIKAIANEQKLSADETVVVLVASN